MNEQTRKDLLTIPNLLSAFRLLLVPLFVALYFSELPDGGLWAAAVLLLSGVTDVADGVIARRFDMISAFGKFIDPLADKVTQATVCCCLAIRHHTFIPLFVVCFIKELLMLIGGVWILKSGKKIASSKWWGKAATCVLFAVILTAILFDDLSRTARIVLSAVGSGAVICSLILYIPEFLKIKNADTGGK